MWDCSSLDGGEGLSDSDSSEDFNSEVTKREAQKKFERLSKAEKAFSEMLSRLASQIPAKSTTLSIGCNKHTKEKGTCTELFHYFLLPNQNGTQYVYLIIVDVCYYVCY